MCGGLRVRKYYKLIWGGGVGIRKSYKLTWEGGEGERKRKQYCGGKAGQPR